MRALVWEEYSSQRQRLADTLAERLRNSMNLLVGDSSSADVLLVAVDGRKLPAHECILRARAPGFYQRHVEATLAAMGPHAGGALREVAIGDIDSAALEFFIRSVYTEDEIARLPVATSSQDEDDEDRRDSNSRASQRSFDMTESQEMDDELLPKGDHPNMDHSGGMPDSGYRQYGGTQAAIASMTSFRDLAAASPMNSSCYSTGRSEVADIPEEDELETERERSADRHSGAAISKFIRLDSCENEQPAPRKRSSFSSEQKAIFPMFIGLDEGATPAGFGPDRVARLAMSRSGSSADSGFRGRSMMSKRLSVNSLTSLTSLDLTPGQEVTQIPVVDRSPCSKLAADLLRMYDEKRDTDVVVRCDNGELKAHRCILSVTCPFFRQHLEKSNSIELKGYGKNTVDYLLSFLYGGLTTIPDDVDAWELVSLATHLNLPQLSEVVTLHLKASRCHWFHRPCASCVSSVFDALPQFASVRCLKPLYEEALAWQARYFSRIWKGRVFMHLNERWQRECFEAVINNMDDETVIDTILGCERLQLALLRCKSSAAPIVLSQVEDVLDVSMQYLIHSFHLVVTSQAFRKEGKGLALNLGILEELLPPLIHSLSADVAIKSFKGLSDLVSEVRSVPASPKRSMGIPLDDWSPRFVVLVRRLFELLDKHLLHYAAAVVKADAWSLLEPFQQQRIRDAGLFVDFRQPKMAPPKLSSLNRTYKRSSSVGVHPTSSRERQHSVERAVDRERPLSMVGQEERSKEEHKEDDASLATPLVSESGTVKIAEQPRETEPLKETQEKERPKSRSKTPESDRPKSARSGMKSPAPSKVKRETSGERPKPSAQKKKVLQQEEGRLERQGTHTIMSAPPRDVPLPGPSPKHVVEKPKSVVKPIFKETPLAASQAVPKAVHAPTPTTKAASATGAPARSKREESIRQRTAAAAADAPSKSRSAIPAPSSTRRPTSARTQTARGTK